MKRVLTFATTGLFVTGLALLPMSVRADQTVTGGKSVTPAPAASTMTPGTASGTSGAQTSSATSGAQTATVPVKKDDKKVTATPGAAAPASHDAAAKTPAKGS